MPASFDTAGELEASLAVILSTVSTIGTLQSASPIVLSTLETVIGNGVSFVAKEITKIDGEIRTDSVAGMIAGTPAPDLWPILMMQANDSRQLANLLTMRAYTGRAGINVANAPG